MTLLEITAPPRESSIPVLETERLVMRAPRLGDAKAMAALANDRRIAENTRRIPHPYSRSDARDFIGAVNGANGGTAFLITLRDETIIGACGIALQDGAPDVGFWLGIKSWGQGLCHRSGARSDRFCLHRAQPRRAAGRRPRDKPGFSARAGKMRLSVDGGRPLPHSGRWQARYRSTASGSTAACGGR